MVVEIMVVSAVLRLLGLVQPFVFQALIDRVLPFQREASLVLILVVLLFSTAFSAAFDALVSYLGNHMAVRLTAELGGRIFRHILDLPLATLQRWQIGETLARIGEMHTVRGFLTGSVSGIALDALFAAVYVGALIAISPLLTVVVMIILPLQIAASGIVGPLLRKRLQNSFAANSRHQSRLVEAFGNAMTVKALAAEDLQAARFQRTLAGSLSAGFRVTRVKIAAGVVDHILANGSVIVIIFLGSQLVFSNELTLGELIAFHLLADKVAGPVLSLSRIWEEWQALKIARLRLGDFLNMKGESEAAKPPLRLAGPVGLELEAVSFRYDEERPLLEALSLAFPAGRPTLIVGQSGCGKSTLARLLAGLYQPQGGRILANGRDIAAFDPRSVRRAIGYLPQEPRLFSGTIRENLLMGRADAGPAEIEAALTASGADLFVYELPGGVDADVGEHGDRLSGGQRQRVALARTLIADHHVLILDEPTSALDEASAAIVVDTLHEIGRSRTLIVISHNPRLLGPGARRIDFHELIGRPLPEAIPA